MNEYTISRGKFIVPLLIAAAAMILLGAGCAGGSSAGPSDDSSPTFIQIPREAGVSSDFAGADGATTEATFDALSAGYNVYLKDEGYAGGTNFTFGLYLDSVEGEMTTTDVSGNKIRLDEIGLDDYLLKSAGADTFPNTTDDHYKAYQD